MTNQEMLQLSEKFNQKLITVMSDFFKEESIPKELLPAIEIDIKLNLSKLPPTTDRQVSLLIGEQRISSSISVNQSILLRRVACSPCSNPDPNDICTAWGNYCSDT